MIKKFFTCFVLALLAITAQAQDELTWWGYYTTESTSITGNNKVPGTYEQAMFVPGDADLKGISIASIRIQTRLSASSSENVKFWIRTSLDGENVVEVTPESVSGSSFTTVNLDTPYALPETGAYVGYTFTVTQWWNEYEGTPVVYAKKPAANSFFLKQPGETEFTDKSANGCMAAQIGFTAPKTKTWWGNYTGSEQTGLMGNYQTGVYEAAMFVAGDGSLGGAEISAMRAQTRLYSNAKDFKFWIRATLDGENLAEAVPETVASSGMTEAQFASAYVIPETGVYVGYSFNLPSIYSDYDYTPVVYAKKPVAQGFYLKQPGETEFADKSSTGSLAAQIEIAGGSMAENSVQVADDIDDMVALVGMPVKVTLNLTNQGVASVESIDLTYTLNGEEQEAHVVLPEPIEAMMGAKKSVDVELGAPTAAGQQEVTIVITKVNGKDNATTGRKAKCTVVVNVISESAQRKAVAEIFYNATNGFVGRAIVGQKRIQENLGDNAIAFLIDHYSGKQAVASYSDFQKIFNATSYTNKYNTYPVAEVNRSLTTDPYTGAVAPSTYAANHFAADQVVKGTTAEVTEAAVSLKAEWKDDTKTAVSLTATANFMGDFKNAPYRLAFVVVKDNVKETLNNYITYYKTAYADDDMEEWRNNPYTNTDYALNSVAVASSDVNGIVSSLPKTLTAGQDYTFDYELEVPVAEGQEEADNARAIVMLINKDTKRIINAAIAKVLTHDEAVGIENVKPAVADDAVFDLQGRRVAQPAKGLYIRGGRKVVMK